MTSDTTTGVPNPDKPGHWLVPPWPPGASFHVVVQHFVLRHPWSMANTAHLLAYYEGFQAALRDAPVCDLTNPGDRLWHQDMRACVDRCVRTFRDKHAAESRPARRTAAAMRPAA